MKYRVTYFWNCHDNEADFETKDEAYIFIGEGLAESKDYNEYSNFSFLEIIEDDINSDSNPLIQSAFEKKKEELTLERIANEKQIKVLENEISELRAKIKPTQLEMEKSINEMNELRKL